MALKKAILISEGCMRAEFDYKDKKILILAGEPYITADEEEQLFLATQRHIGLLDPDEKELKHHLYHIKNLPDITKDVLKNSNLALALKYRPEFEDEIREAYKRFGFDVGEDDQVKNNFDNFESKKLVDALEKKGFLVFSPDKAAEMKKDKTPVPEEDLPTPAVPEAPAPVVKKKTTKKKTTTKKKKK